jgi:hypothetical protein
MKNIDIKVRLAGLIALAMLGCNGEVTNSSSPVLLVVTNTQVLSLIDLNPATQNDACNQNVGTINMQVLPKNSAATGDFVQVRVTRYRVSYRRLDGGTMVPAPFVRPIDTLIGLNQSAGLSNFLIVDGDALTQAPFAALLPQNGGRDPETGRPVVKLEIIVEIFGATLAGDNVSDSTSFPLEFCYGCGGCG